MAFDPRNTPTTPPVTPPTAPPVVTPPVTIVKPIYDVAQLTQAEFESDRNNIINGLIKAKIIKKDDIYTTNPNVDSIQVVKWLKENSPNEDYKIIADRTHKSLLDLKKLGFKFPFEFKKELKDRRGRASNARGRVTPTGGTSSNLPIIYFNQIADIKIEGTDKPNPRRNGINFETMLHEHIHQATLAQIYSRNYDFAKYYGLENTNPRVIKAVNQLKDQQKRIKSFYNERIKFYKNLDLTPSNNNSREQYITAYNKASAIEKEIADIFIRPINLEQEIEIPLKRSFGFQKIYLKNFRDYRIDYQLYSRELQRNQDVSEIITFGLTNRKFQEMLESIPYKNNKTLWQSFVESIRTILGIPAKLDTELYAFLSNTSEVLDLGQTGLESLVPRAPPIELEKKPKKPKEPDTVPFATRPTEVVVTKPFTYTKAKPEEAGMDIVYHNGELNNYKLQIFKFDDGSWYLESPAEQMINGVTLKSDISSINLNAFNKKDAVTNVKNLWLQLLRNGSYTYGVRGENKLILDEGVTLNEARQDVPTFSRISKRGELDNRIADLDRRIEIKENTLRQDGQYLGTASYNRMSNEIDVLKGQRARLIEERNNLPPEQVPLFSRAATKDSPAYLDLTKENLEYTNEWAKNETENTSRLVLPFITRMPIDDFLMLTSDKTIFQLIKSEKPKNVDVMGDTVALNPNFDPDIFNKLPRRMNRYVGAYPYLSINEDGKVIGHEGRHRLVLGQKDGAIDAPVIIMFEPTGKALPQKEKIYSANNLEDLGIKSLLPQFKKSLTDKVELLVDTNIINDQNINQALAIATLPDGIQERQRLNNEDKQSALFSIQQIQSVPANLKNNLRYSAQLEGHYNNLVDLGYLESSPEDVPLFSRASLTPKQSEMPILNREDFSSFGREEVGKIYSEGIFDQLEGSRLGGTREKPGALKVAITNGLKNKKIQEASKNFLQQFTNSRGNLILFRSLNIPENENIRNYGQLPEDNFASTTLNPREAQAIGRNLFNRAYNAGATWNTEILRYEVPMDKVIGYVPTLIQAMRSNYLDTYTSNLAGSGYRSREEIEEEQAEMDEAGDFYYQEEQSIEELLDDENYKLDEYINEAEVVADLRGIKPTYQYSPKTRAREEASITRDIPLFSRASRNFSDGNSNESIKRREAVKVAEERTKETPRGDVPFYNMNASDIALEAAIEFNQDPLKTAPDDIPTFSKAMPSNLQEAANTVGVATPKQSQATRLIDFASDPIASIKKQI